VICILDQLQRSALSGARQLAAEQPDRSIAAMGSVTDRLLQRRRLPLHRLREGRRADEQICGLTAIILTPLFWPLT
jgi:hypothetical protein